MQLSTYLNSGLRIWLIGTLYDPGFYGTAFTDEEKNAIASSVIINENNPQYNTGNADSSSDKVFELSLFEATNNDYGFSGLSKDEYGSYYLTESETRAAKATGYAAAKDITLSEASESSPYYGNGEWWTRTAGTNSSFEVTISPEGGAENLSGLYKTSEAGVRPAIRVDLSKITLTKSGTVSVTDPSFVYNNYTDSTVTEVPRANTLNYTGESRTLVTAGEATGGTLVYSLDGCSWSESLPTATDAGQYTVYYKVIGSFGYNDTDVESVSVTISKATPTISELPTASGINYGQSLADSTLSGGTAKYGTSQIAGAFAWTDGTVVPNVSDSGTTEYEVTFTPEDSVNYNTVTTVATVAVNAVSATCTAPAAREGLTYTEEDQALVTAGEAVGGTLYYALGTDDTTVPSGGWGAGVPAGNAAGTYYVWYKVEADDNHLDPAPSVITVSIGQAAVECTAPVEKALLYNGEAQELVTAGSTDVGEMYYALGDNNYAEPESGWSTDVPEATDAGTYYVWYKVVADSSYDVKPASCVKAGIVKPSDGTIEVEDPEVNIKWNYETADATVSNETSKWDVVEYGTYKQSAVEGESGVYSDDPIEWIVLDVNGDKALLLSKKALDVQAYNTTDEAVTWESSSVRQWLNNTFYEEAFTASERTAILNAQVDNSTNPVTGISCGNDTTDRVFLLSLEEAHSNEYGFSAYNVWNDNSDIPLLELSEYCDSLSQYCSLDSDSGYYYTISNKNWWLRTNGAAADKAVAISGMNIDCESVTVTNKLAVRPAIWVDLSEVSMDKTGTYKYHSNGFVRDEDVKNLTEPEARTGLVYYGNAYALCYEPNPYKVSTLYSTDGNIWTSFVPSAQDFGTYTFYYKTSETPGLSSDDSSFGEPKTLTVTISQRSISDAGYELSDTTLTYTGAEQTVDVKSVYYYYNGKIVLIDDDDYEVSGNTATEPGEYTLTIKGVDGYCDTITVNWRIVDPNAPADDSGDSGDSGQVDAGDDSGDSGDSGQVDAGDDTGDSGDTGQTDAGDDTGDSGDTGQTDAGDDTGDSGDSGQVDAGDDSGDSGDSGQVDMGDGFGDTDSNITNGFVVKVSGAKYLVTSSNTVTYTAPKNKKIKKATVPATVTIDGSRYKVTSISAGAFKGCKKLKTITIKSKDIKVIGAKAFKNCKKLKKVVVKSKAIKKMVKKAVKKSGLKTSKVKIKVKK